MAMPENTVRAVVRFFLPVVCVVFSSLAGAGTDVSLDEIEKLIRQRNYAVAAQRLKPLADGGNPEALYRLAGLYRAGKGLRKDLDAATKLYRRSAGAGYADAQFALALLLEKSGSPSANAEAREWYQKAAEQEHRRALAKLQQQRESSMVAKRSTGQAEIFDAIRHNDTTLINSLISNDVDLNLTDTRGNSTLMTALVAGWPRLALDLVARSTQLEQVNLRGDRPISIAADRGYTEVVAVLLDKNVNPNRAGTQGNTALMLAVKNDHATIVKMLLDRGADHSLVDDKNRSAVDLAYHAGSKASRAVFAARGIKPGPAPVQDSSEELARLKRALDNRGDRYEGWPLLNVAIELGETSVSDRLIALKSDLDATDSDGNNALHVAARGADIATMKKLISAGANVNALNHEKETALYLVVTTGIAEGVDILLESGADPSIATRSGATPLEAAVRNNRTGITVALLRHKTGYSGIHRALLIAVQNRMEKLSRVLIGRDKSLGSLDDEQRSVLWHCADKGLFDTAALLLDSGKIDIDRKDVNGYSPLAQAVKKNHFDMLRLLVDAGADLDVQTLQGNTLLMLAVQSENPAAVDYLLTRDSRIDAQNSVGETALMLAAAGAQNRIIEMLIAAGADLKLRNNEDLNAFQIADNAGHKDTAQLIHDRSNFVFKLFN